MSSYLLSAVFLFTLGVMAVMPSSCLGQSDGVMVIKPGASAVKAKCHNGYSIIDVHRDVTWKNYFLTFKRYGRFGGPTKNAILGRNATAWKTWFLPYKKKGTFSTSFDCNTCAAPSITHGQIGSGYYMTGNYYGCKWYNRNCDAASTCRRCKDNYNSVLTNGTRPFLVYNAAQTYHWACGYDWWNHAPSVGTNGTNCVCYKPAFATPGVFWSARLSSCTGNRFSVVIIFPDETSTVAFKKSNTGAITHSQGGVYFTVLAARKVQQKLMPRQGQADDIQAVREWLKNGKSLALKRVYDYTAAKANKVYQLFAKSKQVMTATPIKYRLQDQACGAWATSLFKASGVNPANRTRIGKHFGIVWNKRDCLETSVFSGSKGGCFGTSCSSCNCTCAKSPPAVTPINLSEEEEEEGEFQWDCYFC